MQRASLLTTALFATLAVACSGDDESGSASPSSVTLDNGAVASTGSGRALTVEVGGRGVLRLAEGAAPQVRKFEQFTNPSLFGITTFDRIDETRISLDASGTSGASATSFTVKLSGPDGAAGTLEVVPLRDDATRVTFTVTGVDDVGSLALPLDCDAEASFYGFGEQYNATNQRGESFDLFVNEQGIGREPGKPVGGINGGKHTTYFPMPYFLDARGHGVLVKTAQRTLVDLCAEDEAIAWLEAESGKPMELVVFHGPTPADVVRQLGDEVGRPTAPPDWAWELWIGAQGGRDSVLAEADALEAANIPARVLWVQDWTGQRINLDGGSGVQYRWQEDPDFYPDIAGMISSLNQRGYRFLSYANPFVDPKLPNHFPDMDEQGLLIKRDGETYVPTAPNGASSQPDLTNPDAREYVKTWLKRMVVELGMDGWMADFGEWLPLESEPFDGSDPVEAHNLYPVEWHRLWREVMDELRPDGDFVVFARSGFTGVHDVSQVHWVGDQEANFSEHDGLPTVVPAMLNLSLSGIPFVTHDIAGFSGGPSTKELFMRWTELGAFTPIMRTHEGAMKDDNWSWEKDQETTDHFRRFALIHEALGPELKTLAQEAAQSSLPLVRHLIIEFPDDPASRGISDQYLLGPDLLVAPVVEEGATERSVYLPPGTWFHVWTGDEYDGGQTVEVDAPIGSPPVFSRGADRTDLRAIQ